MNNISTLSDLNLVGEILNLINYERLTNNLKDLIFILPFIHSLLNGTEKYFFRIKIASNE